MWIKKESLVYVNFETLYLFILLFSSRVTFQLSHISIQYLKIFHNFHFSSSLWSHVFFFDLTDMTFPSINTLLQHKEMISFYTDPARAPIKSRRRKEK